MTDAAQDWDAGLEEFYGFRPETPLQHMTAQVINKHALDLARVITAAVPDCPERARALIAIEEAMLWTTGAIARKVT